MFSVAGLLAFLLERVQDTLYSKGPADAGGWRAAEAFDEAVVAAATAEGRLRAYPQVVHLEGCAPVVVEATYEAVIDVERYGPGPEAGLDRKSGVEATGG